MLSGVEGGHVVVNDEMILRWRDLAREIEER
jgi:hypothetical protein